jgi:hypothetical protein
MKDRPLISIHAPKALKPQTQEEFGSFLAGLIDSDGHISKLHINISFNFKDISVAYYVKKSIGFGSVKKIKNKFAVTYVCSNRQGQLVIANLIRNKLRHLNKIEQFNSRLVERLDCEKTSYVERDLILDHWLAGFLQGDGSLQIKLLSRRNLALRSCRLTVQIDQKNENLLRLIKLKFGGYLGYRKAQDTYYYSSVSLWNSVQFIRYLDTFQLMGSQLTAYWLWRKTFLVIQTKSHLRSVGLAKVALLKASLSKLRIHTQEIE